MTWEGPTDIAQHVSPGHYRFVSLDQQEIPGSKDMIKAAGQNDPVERGIIIHIGHRMLILGNQTADQGDHNNDA